MAKRIKTKKKMDKRRIPRRHLVFYLRVFDGMTSRVLGHLVDISPRGAMLICDSPVEENQEFRLRLRLPREIAGRSELLLEGTCRWCRPDENPDFHLAGFSLRGIDPDFEKHLKTLIEDFGLEETAAITNSDRPACNLTQTRGH